MNTEIKNLLGIKQEDLAMILGVSRGQLSMYIIGKRNLPIEAKLILSELGLLSKATAIENATHDNQKITSVENIEGDTLPYFTTIIVRN